MFAAVAVAALLTLFIIAVTQFLFTKSSNIMSHKVNNVFEEIGHNLMERIFQAVVGQLSRQQRELTYRNCLEHLLSEYDRPTQRKLLSAVRLSKGYTVLMAAAEAGKMDDFKMLLKHRAPLDDGNTLEHWTPLHVAADMGRVEMVEMLLKAGANPNMWAYKSRRIYGQVMVRAEDLATTDEMRKVFENHHSSHQFLQRYDSSGYDYDYDYYSSEEDEEEEQHHLRKEKVKEEEEEEEEEEHLQFQLNSLELKQLKEFEMEMMVKLHIAKPHLSVSEVWEEYNEMIINVFTLYVIRERNRRAREEEGLLKDSSSSSSNTYITPFETYKLCVFKGIVRRQACEIFPNMTEEELGAIDREAEKEFYLCIDKLRAEEKAAKDKNEEEEEDVAIVDEVEDQVKIEKEKETEVEEEDEEEKEEEEGWTKVKRNRYSKKQQQQHPPTAESEAVAVVPAKSPTEEEDNRPLLLNGRYYVLSYDD